MFNPKMEQMLELYNQKKCKPIIMKSLDYLSIFNDNIIDFYKQIANEDEATILRTNQLLCKTTKYNDKDLFYLVMDTLDKCSKNEQNYSHLVTALDKFASMDKKLLREVAQSFNPTYEQN
jgi:site-specific DNA-adenine methylase